MSPSSSGQSRSCRRIRILSTSSVAASPMGRSSITVSAGSMIATPVSWAMREHFHWFFNWRKPISAVTESADDHPPPTAYPHSEE